MSIRANLKFVLIISLFVIPTFGLPFTSALIEKKGENTKIGFSWINGPIGASELTGPAYGKATEIGCEIEHRDYGWGELEYNWQSVNEWAYYLNMHTLERSVAISVINNNYTAIPYYVNFTSFNDPYLISGLKNFTKFILTTLEVDYISFGSEINCYFETWFDSSTQLITNRTMLDDYIALCEEMYNYVHDETNNTISVLTIFRNQRPADLNITKAIINDFANACDLYAVSSRIFTNDVYSLALLTEDEIINRFQDFADLCGTKNFAITNTYTISDSRAGSSQTYQASYVKAFFNLVDHFGDNLEFICWYSLYDYPPGYLGMLFHPYLEAHSTAGLLTYNGDLKSSCLVWIEEMQQRGKNPHYKATWKIVLGSLVLTAVVAFIIFAYVMEGLDTFKDQEEKKKPIEIDLTLDDKETDDQSSEEKTLEEEVYEEELEIPPEDFDESVKIIEEDFEETIEEEEK